VPEKRRKEKRRAARIQPFVVPCRVIDKERQVTAYLVNLSTNGARISSDEPLPAGARAVTLEVRFSRSAPVCRLPARIKWMKPGSSPREAAVLGVTFERLSVRARALLDSAIKEFRRRAKLVA
jgi:hypothetical protein